MGVSVQEFGGLCQWAIQVINTLIGALDQQGGALLTSPAFAYVTKGSSAGGHFNLFQSRVSGLPEFASELPAACMAEEILTPGEGQIKSMVTIAGNPLISSVNSNSLEKAFESLDFYVAIDLYINATTRHADVILPPTSPLEHDHYDIAFLRLAVHNTVKHNPAVFEPNAEALHDWQIFNKLAARINQLKKVQFKPLPSPDQIVDAGIQTGPYGTSSTSALTLSIDMLKEHPHGIDLGPLQPGLAERLCTQNGKINLAPEIYLTDLTRLKQSNSHNNNKALTLIGRRHIRSNNSWMHNYHRLVKGKPRWQLIMHPDDCTAHNIEPNSQVKISSDVGSVSTTVVCSDEVMPGVVSLPHGWGHQNPEIKLSIARQQKGVNCNVLTDDRQLDQLSGNANLNGIKVTVVPA
jgi:anaerobic selenocysteine-containing dehydrogenase